MTDKDPRALQAECKRLASEYGACKDASRCLALWFQLEAAIDRLADMAAEVMPSQVMTLENPLDHQAEHLTGGARKGLDGWVAVSDRMPDAGVPVLAFVANSAGKTRRIRATYAPPKTIEANCEDDEHGASEYGEEPDTYWLREGWYETNEYEEVHWHVDDPVSHWMPLPAPPGASSVNAYAQPPVRQDGQEGSAAMSREVRMTVMMAYGHLWHVNNEPMAPVPMYSSEKAAYKAREHLRDLLTTQERGEAINQVGFLIGRYDGVDAEGVTEEGSSLVKAVPPPAALAAPVPAVMAVPPTARDALARVELVWGTPSMPAFELWLSYLAGYGQPEAAEVERLRAALVAAPLDGIPDSDSGHEAERSTPGDRKDGEASS